MKQESDWKSAKNCNYINFTLWFKEGEKSKNKVLFECDQATSVHT